MDGGQWDNGRNSGGRYRISLGLFSQDSVPISGALSNGFVLVNGKVHGWGSGKDVCRMGGCCSLHLGGPSFIFVWALLLHWGIGDRSQQLVLGRVSDAPQVPRCCHLWGNLST